ncbi:unnamed protein product [Vitrella brassicaformis CCMP3155]|uniref:Uncharacterized protein n=2 Tax=Vitrella brassicaformis TaxID=1169539 RepID=A0A0G4EW81_VITBC|nr:unnamed protein product [Vitrella brassicaformis CCMP3155]|mmetsp:Transcript_38310/g.95967  ORF Transcript_38310/g.95967 Transcript_38310/m.95967 type:complete len:228 (+) Transcript_38310:29-712(+)|eukprot:CEM02508.1 unnamed protein product [Vitrella brassicaformis CCMP3155]
MATRRVVSPMLHLLHRSSGAALCSDLASARRARRLSLTTASLFSSPCVSFRPTRCPAPCPSPSHQCSSLLHHGGLPLFSRRLPPSPRPSSSPSPLASSVGQRRAYQVRFNINWVLHRLRHRIHKAYRKKRYGAMGQWKSHSHSRFDLRFRLTRFGWQNRMCGRYGKAYRDGDSQKRKRLRGFEFTHRQNWFRFRWVCPTRILKPRDPPHDKNVNLKKCRKHLPAHLG